MKFFLDENMPNSTSEMIEDMGHEAVNVREIEIEGIPDAEVGKEANKREAFLITRDKDFGNPEIYSETPRGVIIVRIEGHAEIITERTIDFLEDTRQGEIENRIIILEKGRTRERKLKS